MVGGHQRLKLLATAGVEETSCIVVNLPLAEEKALNVTLNNPHVCGEFTEGLDALLAEIRQEIPDLDIASINLDELIGSVVCDQLTDGLTDPDAVPEPPDAAITKPGDLWVLGSHRLLCGDSSKKEDLDRLLSGCSIDLVNTDPPYNVKVEPRSSNAIAAGLSSFPNEKGGTHHQRFDAARSAARKKKTKATTKKLRAKDRPLANDSVSPECFDALLSAWFGNIARVLKPGGSFYVWGGFANLSNYPQALKANALYFSQAIIWVKQHPVLTRKDFMTNHEWCFYGWREGAGHKFVGPNNIPDTWNPVYLPADKDGQPVRVVEIAPEVYEGLPLDVWKVKKVSPQAMVHLTEKPVELAVRAIQYSSRRGENVLDLFGGSGSTLIAAQRSGRNAYLMELDALYCDVIVRRWEEFTGRKAERQAKG